MSRPPSPTTLSPPAQGARLGRGDSMRQLWVLMATVFVDMIGAMIVLPLLPFYVKQMGAKPSAVGLLISTFFAAQIVVSPLWGRCSDRYGRRPMILAGLMLSAVAFTLFGLAQSLLLLYLTRLVQGAGSGTVGVVQAYVADLFAPEDRAKALGWVTAATSAGVGIGALIGSSLTYFGNAAPGYFAAGLCLLNLAFAWRWLPESKRQTVEPVRQEGGEVSVWRRLWQVVRQPASPVGSLIWIYASGMMIFMAMNGVLGLYLGQVYGVTKHTIGYFYSFVSFVSVPIRGLLLEPAVRRLGEVGAMRLGTLALAAGMGAIPVAAALAAPPWMRIACFGLIILLVPVGTALLFPTTTALVSRRSPREEMGQIMGVQQLFGGIARMVGPIWSAWLFGWYVNLPFWVAAALMLGVAALTWRIRPEPRPAAQPTPLQHTAVEAAEVAEVGAAAGATPGSR